jgi:hypothetical protein
MQDTDKNINSQTKHAFPSSLTDIFLKIKVKYGKTDRIRNGIFGLGNSRQEGMRYTANRR